MRHLSTAALAAIMLMGGIAHAETVPARTFVEKAASSGMFEIESSKIALRKSGNADIKNFAQTMISDHGKASAKLQTAATADGVAVPKEIDAAHKAQIDQLQGAPAGSFDNLYVQMQTKGHEEAVALFTGLSPPAA